MVVKTQAPADAAKLTAPGAQVESMVDLIAEAKDLEEGDQAAANRTQQAQQQAKAGQQQAAAMDAMNEIREALLIGRNVAAKLVDGMGMLPKATFMAIWTDDDITAMAGPAAAIMERHGGDIGPFMERYGPYVMMGATMVMPAIATIKAVRHHKALNVQAREVPAGEGATGG